MFKVLLISTLSVRLFQLLGAETHVYVQGGVTLNIFFWVCLLKQFRWINFGFELIFSIRKEKRLFLNDILTKKKKMNTLNAILVYMFCARSHHDKQAKSPWILLTEIPPLETELCVESTSFDVEACPALLHYGWTTYSKQLWQLGLAYHHPCSGYFLHAKASLQTPSSELPWGQKECMIVPKLHMPFCNPRKDLHHSLLPRQKLHR